MMCSGEGDLENTPTKSRGICNACSTCTMVVESGDDRKPGDQDLPLTKSSWSFDYADQNATTGGTFTYGPTHAYLLLMCLED